MDYTNLTFDHQDHDFVATIAERNYTHMGYI